MSRKAVVGAAWAALAFVAFFLWAVVRGVEPAGPEAAMRWWQWGLVALVLVPGVAAPVGTTVLGWTAVADIRRSGHRIGGLALAVFDGLVFPLLALDLVLGLVVLEAFHWFTATSMAPQFRNPLLPLVVFAAMLVCAVVDGWVVRAVWRRVRRDGAVPCAGRDGWWSRPAGALALGAACIAVMLATAGRAPRTIRAQQVAAPDAATGTLSTTLPNGGRVELLAVADANAAPNQWWKPDGNPETGAAFEVLNPVESSASGRVAKDFVFRVTGLPADGAWSGVESDSVSGGSSGGAVARDGRTLADAIQARLAFPPGLDEDNVRVAFALEPWRTVVVHEGRPEAGTLSRVIANPSREVTFHPPTRTERGDAQVAVVFGPEDAQWVHRVVAVDTAGIEHVSTAGQGMPVGRLTLWTYTFVGLPLASTREFRLQVRPIHRVEFRGIALRPRSPLPPPQALHFAEALELQFDELLDLDTARVEQFPTAAPGSNPLAGPAEGLLWAQQHGFDAVAGNGHLEVLDAEFALVDNAQWDQLGPQQVIRRLYEARFRPRTLGPVQPGRLPVTYAYHTREDGYGLLQLVGFDPQRPGATVRLKRVVRPASAVAATAQRDPATGEVVVRPAHGGSVALVALKRAAGPADAWRRVDGSALTGFDCVVGPDADGGTRGSNGVDLLFRVSGMHGLAGKPLVEVPGAARVEAGSPAVVNGSPDASLVAARVAWPSDDDAVPLRLGLPLADWHVIRGHEPMSRSFTKTRLGGDPAWDVEMQAAGMGTRGSQVTVVFGTNYPAWDLGVFASRARGPLVAGVADAAVTNGVAVTRTYVFPGLRLEDVQNFQVRARPVDWAVFPGLRPPGDAAAVRANPGRP